MVVCVHVHFFLQLTPDVLVLALRTELLVQLCVLAGLLARARLLRLLVAGVLVL